MAIIVALLLRFPAFGYMHRAYAIGDAADVNTVNSVPISITNTINDLTDDAVHVVNKNKYEFTQKLEHSAINYLFGVLVITNDNI